MPNHATREIRNVAVVGHGGSGKTTLVESLLAAAGAVAAAGSVEKGNRDCDYEPEERAHQQSLWNAVASLAHDSAHVSFVDTPGYPDFLGRALPALAAVETAAVVVDARSGIQTTTRRMMEGGGLARPRAPRRREQDRCAGPGPRGAPREPSGGLRPGVPSPSACRRPAGRRWWIASSTRPVRRHRVLLGRGGAEPGGGPSGGNGRGADGDLLRSGRSLRRRAPRRVPDRAPRGAPRSRVLRLRGLRRGGWPAARRARPAHAEPRRREPAGVLRSRRRRRGSRARSRGGGGGAGLPGDHRPLRRPALRVPHPRRHGDPGFPAPRRRRAQALQGGAPVPPPGQGARGDRRRGSGRHLRRREGGRDRLRGRCCTAWAAGARRGPNRFPCPRRCTALPSRPGPAATSRSSPTPSRSSRPKIRASRSSTAPRPGRR